MALLTDERSEGNLVHQTADPLKQQDTAEVTSCQQCRPQPVDEGAVDNHVYVVEPIVQDC